MQVLEDGRISVSYSRYINGFMFASAIVISPEEYEAMSESDMVALQDARFAAWVAYVDEASSTPADQPTTEVTNGE
jgi:hypothetical protein